MFRSLLLCTLVAAPLARAADVFSRFDAWAGQYRAAKSDFERAGLRAAGLPLARERRAALRELMERSPQAALARAAARDGLPWEVVEQLERPLDALGRFEVLCAYGQPLQRFAVVGPERYRVTAYGRLLALPTLDAARLRGFVLDGQAVLDETRLPLNGPLPSAWTVGQKRLLMIRVDFSDDPGDPITVAAGTAVLNQTDAFWRAASYGQTSATATVTPTTLRMPQTKASYASANATSQLLSDARTAARNAGYDPASYSFEMVAFRRISSWSWAGLGYVGGKGTWLNGSFDLGVVAHELGHNLGLSHANFWLATGDTIIGSGSSQEYGNPFDIMGSGDDFHYGAWYHEDPLDWFGAGEAVSVTASGTYRIADLEQSTLGGSHALRVPISGTRDYWVEFRPGRGGLLGRSVIVTWGQPSRGASLLLDMTPWTQSASDAPLPVGRTFSDSGAGIHVTPTGVVAANPTAIDVVVNRGGFSGNHAPTVSLAASATQVSPSQSVTFTATAADADADPLAYFWDFGDGSASTNTATATRSFSSARDVLARVTVSDMKGGVASAQVAVRVGTPSTVRVAGRVADNGAGVEGVRVVSGSRFTFTDSNGDYLLTGLNQGNATVTAVKPGWTLSPTFTNPVSVGASGATGIDFTAFRAGFGIFGRVTSVGQGLPNITVSAGPYSAVTNTSGDYVLSNVPNGIYTLTATGAPGQSFLPAGWSNPVQVNGAPVTGRNFQEDVVPVSGVVTGLAGPHTVTDGVRTATTALSGSDWAFTLPRVPPGVYNVVATAPGQLITPSFTNPVTVGSSPVTGLTFTATAGTGYLITGRVDEAGAGLTATTVVAATDAGVPLATGLTDGDGRYALINVPNGDCVVAPQRSGYTFTPVSRAVTIAGASVSGQDFGVLGANAPPFVVFPPTVNPFPVVGTTADLVTLADDPPPGDEASLTYTWTKTLGPAPIAFSRNATNGAKATTVTFTTAGSYGVQVEVKDPGNLAARAQLTVVVPQTPTATAVTPATTTVNVGDTKQFVAALTDQFGNLIDTGGEADWSVSGCGAITAWGRFTAQSTGTCTVTANVLGQVGTATVTVVIGPVPRLLAGPTVTPSPVEGDTASGAVTAEDDGGEAKLTYTWAAITPPAAVTFSPNGTNAAKSTAITFGAVGTYDLRVDVTDELGLTVAGFVRVEVKAGFSRVEVSPATATVQTGKTLQLTAVGRDQAGSQVAAPACSWSASAGAVDGAGLFTAPEVEGTVTVTATCGGKSATATVTVTTTGAGGGGGGGGGAGCHCAGVDGVGPLALLALAAMGRRRRRPAGKTPTDTAAGGGDVR